MLGTPGGDSGVSGAEPLTVIKGSVDMSGMRRKNAAILRAGDDARVRAAATAGAAAAREMHTISPTDTNRYKNGWADVHNDLARVGGVQKRLNLLPLREPKDSGAIEKRLRDQVDKSLGILKAWEEFERKVKARPGFKTSWKNYRLVRRRIRQAEKRVERARQTLREFYELEDGGVVAPVILIGGRKTKNNASLRGLASLRRRVYGGVGSVRVLGSLVVAELRHREPHARFVERRFRVGRRGLAVAKVAGAKVVRNSYARGVAKAIAQADIINGNLAAAGRTQARTEALSGEAA